MEYRRFGRTGLNFSVVTLGGMRYPNAGCKRDEIDARPLPEDGMAACEATLRRAFEIGINHVETALGYGLSERIYGAVWPRLGRPRDSFYLMTKGNPKTYDEAMTMVESQLRRLGTDYVDCYAWHGVNLPDHLELVRQPRGPMAALEKLRAEGVLRHLGFSTHGPLKIIMDAIATDRFEFVNLHYYYFFQRNRPAVEFAAQRGMGVFIISPNDKGGRLYDPPEKLRRLCAPLTPIQFNARFCLSHSEIHTLTFGIDRPEYFEETLGIFREEPYVSEQDGNIQAVMGRQLETLGESYCTTCGECLPCPEEINIPEILRFRNMWKAWEMEGFAKYRYNMLEEKGHWFPGRFGSACTDCGDCLPRCPVKLPIPALLRETHAGLYIEKSAD